jgi:cell division protein ZipA
MEPLRWVLLLVGVIIIALVFAYGRGLLTTKFRLPKGLSRIPTLRSKVSPEEIAEPVPEPEKPVITPKAPPLAKDSKVVTARIMPPPGAFFPAEELILALRSVGLQHGQFDIFHAMADGDEERIRYSVASLVEPGSFDLSNLKDSRYRGISIFMVLPAPEDGVELFDDMLGTARELAKQIDGNLVDEQGGAMSMQRERYMREEVIEFLRRISQSAIRQNQSTDS